MKILKLDMTRGKIKEEDLPDDFTWGGRGLVDYLLTENMNPNSHPLSSDSLFVLACGMLAGTSAPNSSRISVGGKSLLTEEVSKRLTAVELPVISWADWVLWPRGKVKGPNY